MDYLISGEKFGFPLRKVLPDGLRLKCTEQHWRGLKIKTGIKEGKGVFAEDSIKKHTALCNYGGVHISNIYAEKYLLPFHEKCNFLIELHEKTVDGMQRFFLNPDSKGELTFGQLLNHSSLHPNATPKVFAVEENRLDIIFFAKRDIQPDEQILWDYGKNFRGVEACVGSCLRCKKTDKYN